MHMHIPAAASPNLPEPERDFQSRCGGRTCAHRPLLLATRCPLWGRANARLPGHARPSPLAGVVHDQVAQLLGVVGVGVRARPRHRQAQLVALAPPRAHVHQPKDVLTHLRPGHAHASWACVRGRACTCMHTSRSQMHGPMLGMGPHAWHPGGVHLCMCACTRSQNVWCKGLPAFARACRRSASPVV
jgi:hypothetical protein